MTKRKLILIIADVLLLAVFICQCVLKVRDSAKIFEMKDSPDAITITGEKGNVEMVLENGNWIIGSEKYAANPASVDSIIETISSIRALDKVGSANNESALNRYELVDGKKVTVTAKKDGKTLRSIEIGKEATATSQGYITIDGNKEIFLASGNLRYLLNKSVDELRSRVLWQLDKNDINSISYEPVNGTTWALSRMGSGEDTVCNVSGVDIDVDPAKASDWFTALAAISVPVWHGEGADLGGEKIFTAKLGYGFKTATIDVYEIPAVSEDAKPIYWGTSSESPYTFELAGYTVQKFQKNPDSIAR